MKVQKRLCSVSNIAQKIFAKIKENYDKVRSIIRCKRSFLILRSVLICVRGSCSVRNNHVHLDDVSLTGQAAQFVIFNPRKVS